MRLDMNIRFWGVRGSIPAPLTPQQIRSKIDSVVQRISTKDIESPEARARFISTLPDWLYGTTGGNTTCVEVISSDGTHFVLDAGSGIRVLSFDTKPPKNKAYHILFSHFHWDHLQGLPFFNYAYNKQYAMYFYSTSNDLRTILENQMIPPYFPVPIKSFTPNIHFVTVKTGVPFYIDNTTITVKKMRHPGDSFAYKFVENGKTFIFATDVELSASDFERTDENVTFFTGADAIVLDTQYTVKESIEKENWGHSSFCYAVDFAAAWDIKNMFLFHHEPTYDDQKLFSILTASQWYAQYVSRKDVKVHLANEGLEFEV
jgi:phosphoribosyl 1,2-cyclic phosphodiesterase